MVALVVGIEGVRYEQVREVWLAEHDTHLSKGGEQYRDISPIPQHLKHQGCSSFILRSSQDGRQEAYILWRWVWEAPGDDEPVNGCGMLIEATNSMDARKLLGQGRVNADRVADDEVGRELSGPFDRALSIQEQEQDLTTRDAVYDVLTKS